MVLLGIPFFAHFLDQRQGHLQLLVGNAGVARQLEVFRIADFGRVTQRIHDNAVADRDQGAQVLAGADHHGGNRDPASLAQCFAQQGIDLVAAASRREVVGRFIEGQRNRICIDEGHDVDSLCRLGVRQPQVFVAEHNILAIGILVAFDDMVPGDFLAGALVVALEADRREVPLVQHGQVQVVRLHCLVQLHRDMHQAETDCAFPECSCHLYSPILPVIGKTIPVI